MAYNLQENVNRRKTIWVDQKTRARIVDFAGGVKPWQIVRNSLNPDIDTNYVWRQFFASALREYHWTRNDFHWIGCIGDFKKVIELSKP